MAELLDVRRRLEQAREASELRTLSRQRRTIVATLVDEARAILAESGRGSGAGTLDAVSWTLLAAPEEEEQEELRRGRLTRELAASSLDGLDAFAPAPGADDDAAVEEERARLHDEARAAEERAAALEADARAAQDRVEAAQREADTAGSRARKARAAADDARRRADGPTEA